jgi:multimeric flavodoxin WrbA
MNVLAVLGSPRKNGFSSNIAHAFMEQAAEMGAETKTHYLNGLSFKGCQGCNVCKTKYDYCVQKDDLSSVLDDLHWTDIAVFATPVYYWDVPGQFKCFIDRTWSLVKPDYLTNPEPSRLTPGKKAVLIIAQGDVPAKHQDVTERYTAFLKLYGFDVHTIRATECGMEIKDTVAEYMDEAKKLAAHIVD